MSKSAAICGCFQNTLLVRFNTFCTCSVYRILPAQDIAVCLQVCEPLYLFQSMHHVSR